MSGSHPAGTPVRRSPRPTARPAPGSPRCVRSLWALAAQRRTLKRSPALLPRLPSCVRGPAQAQPLLLPLSCGWRRGRRFLSDSNDSAVTHLPTVAGRSPSSAECEAEREARRGQGLADGPGPAAAPADPAASGRDRVSGHLLLVWPLDLPRGLCWVSELLTSCETGDRTSPDIRQ